FQAARIPLMLAAMKARLGQISGAAQAAPQGAPDQGATDQEASGAPTAAAPGAPAAAPASAAPRAPMPSAFGSASGGPMGLLNASLTDSILGLPWADAERDIAKTGLQYDPQTAAYLQYAKNAVTQDQIGLQQAVQNGNQPLARIWDKKLRQDAGALQVARNSGIRQELVLSG